MTDGMDDRLAAIRPNYWRSKRLEIETVGAADASRHALEPGAVS